MKTNNSKQPKVSVYIPIYNVAQYIEQCLRSLFEQTLDDIEYIFVDDCTPDNSIEILELIMEEYPTRKSQVKIIRHEKNKGVCAARETGMRAAVGEYIACCEPDDWVENTMYEELYTKAMETGADMISCDHYIESVSGTKYGISHSKKDFDKRMGSWINRKYLSYVWSRIVKREVFEANDIFYPSGVGTHNYGEDAVLMCQLLFYAKTYDFVPKALYHYRIVEGSVSHDVSRLKMRNQSLVEKYIWIFDFLHKQYGDKYNQDILAAKLQIKWEWCENELSFDFYKYWPEVNHFSSLKYLPVSMGRKILLWLAFLRCKWGFNILTKTYRFLQNN